MLEVVSPGALLTLQDRGRPGLAHLGVPPSGPADPWSYEVAILLADGRPDGAGDASSAAVSAVRPVNGSGPVALEVTLGGTRLRAIETCAVALSGGDLGAELDDGTRLAPGRVHRVAAGAEIGFAGGTGMRAYLGLPGGIDARLVLGSASTCVAAALGGIDGRPLRAGDVIAPVRRGHLDAVGRTWPAALAPHPARSVDPIAFVPGPDLRHLHRRAVEAFRARSWRVADACDRMGIRLEPHDGVEALAPGREILSHPMLPGAIQVPADGRPVILFVDGPTIGGYPVIGVVPRWEWPRLGQLRPGYGVRFAAQDAGSARAAWDRQRAALAAGTARAGADLVWERLADGAGW